MADHVSHEYAGFRYLLRLNEEGVAFAATPLSGQHQASWKDKHRRAAIDTYNQDHKK